MPVVRLTKSAIDKLPAADRAPITFWDERLKGFGLTVHPPSSRHPKGRRSFCARYRTQSGRDRRVVLGSYGAITPEQARKQAQAVLAEAAQGGDPLEQRQAQRRERERTRAETVEAYLEPWLAARHRRGKKESTSREIRRLFEKDILPVIGTLPVARVESGDVRRILARKVDAPYVQNRIRAWLRAFFTWTIRQGARTSANPCDTIDRNPEKPRSRFFFPRRAVPHR